MDLTSARTLLRRINRLFDDLDAEPSALERDLLREYVRRFYESLQDGTDAVQPPARRAAVIVNSNGHTADSGDQAPGSDSAGPAVEFEPASPAPEPQRPPRPAPPKPKVIQIPPDVEQDVQRIEHQAPARSYAPPRRIEPVEELDEPATPLSPRPESSPVTGYAPSEPELKPVPGPASPATPPKSNPPLSSELKELFAIEQGRDLSDRLATQPISDLHRAFGINDTLVTKSQLFGNDSTEFNATLKHLNGLTAYDEAVTYLAAGPATRHSWADEAKRGAARTFVKLVRRRYVS